MLKTVVTLLTGRAGLLLSLLGLVFVVVAAYQWNFAAGLAATGVACWLLETRLDMERQERNEPAEAPAPAR